MPTISSVSRLVDRDSAIASALAESGSFLKVSTLPGKNRALVATRDIKAGTTVLVEIPVACVPLPGHADLEKRCPTCLASLLPTPDLDSATSHGLKGPLSAFPDTTTIPDSKKSHKDQCNCTNGIHPENRKQIEAFQKQQDEFLKWAHENCPTMALAGALVQQARAAGINIPSSLLAQYDEDPWTEIAPNPESLYDECRDSYGTEVEEKGKGKDEFRLHCEELCRKSYTMLGLEKAGISQREWDRLVGLVEKNAGSILPQSPFRDALERNISIAAGGGENEEEENGDGGAELDEETFRDYVSSVEKHTQEWLQSWGNDGEESSDEYEEVEMEEYENSDSDDDNSGNEDDDDDVDDELEGDESDGDSTNSPRDNDSGDCCLDISPSSNFLGPLTSLVQCFNDIPPPEYTGLFPAFAIMNHSCCPNVEILYNHGDYTSSTVATQDISCGEEVCHSYICLDELPEVRERRVWLERQHGFWCCCARCVKEEQKQKMQTVLAKKRTKENVSEKAPKKRNRK